MTKKEIKISVLHIDSGDGIINFQISISNGISSTSQDFYGYDDEFKSFATELITFPQAIDHKIKYELGEISEGSAYYILLEVFCHEPNGHSAIHVVLNNNAKRPFTNNGEFYITTAPASLNKLGTLLGNWNPLETKEFIWIAE
jgi:hypothetical protein